MGSYQRIEWVLNEIRPEDKVLDVGCIQHSANREVNPSWLHKKLYNIANYVLGVDYIKEEIDILRSKGYNICYGNAESLDLAETFDVVVVGELMEHLSNPGLFLDRVRRHLNKRGRLIITTPNPFFFYRFCQALFEDVICNIEHTCYYCKRTIKQLLERHGFELKKFKYIPPSISAKGLGRNIAYKLSYILFKFGFRTLGGQGIFVIATPKG